MNYLSEPRRAAAAMIAVVVGLIYLGLTASGAQMSIPPGTGDPVLGKWVLESGSTIMLRADGAIDGDRTGTWNFTGTVDGARDYELHWTHKGWIDYMVLLADGTHLDGKTRKGKSILYVRGVVETAEKSSPSPTASPPATPAEEGPATSGQPKPPQPREPSAPAPEGTNPRDVFVKIELQTDDSGHPVPQVIRLNEKVVMENGERYSGFWFTLNRTEAARKQGGVNRWGMAMYWYFVPPKALADWNIDPLSGEELFRFNPLKLWRFPQLRAVPPKDKDRLIVQQIEAKRLKEGKAYCIEFGFPPDNTEPMDMAFCLGFRKTIWNFHQWKGLDEAIDFLGLEHKGEVNGADNFLR